MRTGEGQSGQATIEWAGLMLCLALIFGALLAGGREAAKGSAGRELGEAIADRMVCAVRERCGAERAAREPAGGGRQGARLGAGARRWGRFARGLGLGLGPDAPLPAQPAGRSGSRHAVRVLAGGRRLVKRVWFACLAFRGWQNDREHPRLLGEARPIKETVGMLNECVNPWSFLFGK